MSMLLLACGALSCAAAGPDDGELDEDAEERDDAVGVDHPLPAIPPGCALKTKVITYNPNGWGTLLDAFEAHPTPCADYFIHLPALAADKSKPRGPAAPQGVRSRAGRFHAAAEFHFGGWSQVKGMTWYQKGVEFRKRMEAAGYNVERGDTWAINELPSTVRHDPTARQKIRNLVRGLYDGPPGAKKRAGIVYVIAMGQQTQNFGPYKASLEEWLSDDAFWNVMNEHVLYWGQETYTDPHHVCVGGTTVGEKAEHINDFTQHPARLAGNGPATVGPARGFFDQAYFPLMTAVWRNEVYGRTNVSLENMTHFVSHQTYAARSWASTHGYPDGRIGFAWDEHPEGATPAQVAQIAKRLARSIEGAYAIDGKAARACSPSGAFTLCQCKVSGASFNDGWKTFASW
jgi:hypothetical protein